MLHQEMENKFQEELSEQELHLVAEIEQQKLDEEFFQREFPGKDCSSYKH